MCENFINANFIHDNNVVDTDIDVYEPNGRRGGDICYNAVGIRNGSNDDDDDSANGNDDGLSSSADTDTIDGHQKQQQQQQHAATGFGDGGGYGSVAFRGVFQW